MPVAETRSGGPLLRDQWRARRAYECLQAQSAESKESQRDYKIAINDLGANILRNGLCAALADLQRRKGKVTETVLNHLAGFGLPGLEETKGEHLFEAVCNLDVDTYMLATRESVRVVQWLKRAAQATLHA